MPGHIGIVACSAEGASLCYLTICHEAGQWCGEDDHPEISMHTHSLARYMAFIYENNWQGVAELMLDSAQKLVTVGATLLICPDNTIHQAWPWVQPASPAPWLHIAEVVADEAQRRGFKRLAILGTRYLMEGPVYPEVLDRRNIAYRIPEPDEREKIHTIIFKELVKGIFLDSSREVFHRIMMRMRDEEGCDAAVLGCTEIPLLVREEYAPLPVLDSTRLLARAALRAALTDINP